MKEVLILSRQATKETMADRGSKHVERSKDGVPQWDGDAATFQEYAELAGHWQESIPYHKRYLCGPRLQANCQARLEDSCSQSGQDGFPTPMGWRFC